jgi:hypothetical protein
MMVELIFLLYNLRTHFSFLDFQLSNIHFKLQYTQKQIKQHTMCTQL